MSVVQPQTRHIAARADSARAVLNPSAMGSALAGAAASLYLLCFVFVTFAWDASVGVFQSLFHGVDVSPLIPAAKPALDLGALLTGVVSLSILFWIFGWVLGVIYNAVSGRGRAV